MKRHARIAAELELVDELARALAAARTPEGVARVLLEQLAGLLEADEAGLVVPGGEVAGTWAWRDGACRHDAGSTDTAPVAEAPCGELVRASTADGSRRLAVRPVEGDAGWVLTVTRAGRAFDERDERSFARLALHAGIALQHMDALDRLRRESAAAHHLARHDALTGLANRTGFLESVAEALDRGTCSAVLLIDLDRFKEINDTLGHHNGDLVLEEVGRRLAGLGALAGPGDLVARLGGDEFGVLLDGGRTEAAVADAVAAVQRETARGVAVADVLVDVGASVGVALPARGADEPHDILRRADVAMYAAKSAHSGATFYTVGLDTHSPQRLSLVPRFRAAIDAGELTPYFQPQVDLTTGRVLGVEALLRWPQAGRGFVPPGEFIPIAEQTDLIGPLTRRLLSEAIAQTAEWHDRGWPLRTSVNLSARNLAEPDLADHILERIAAAGLPPEALCVEVTETAMMTQPDRSRELLGRLKRHGIEVAIDDFGTGHSSLAQLTTLPAGELKIDRSFVTALGRDPAAESVVLAVVALGLNLGMGVVAEGVETDAAAAILTPMGCQVAQGFLYGRAMSPTSFARWYASHGGEQRAVARDAGATDPGAPLTLAAPRG